MRDSYFKIGEFAEICGTAKSTLLYYAKIGLFLPHHIGENGYYYYSPSQIFMYEVIASLREMDVSLDDIKDYITNQNIEHCTEILRRNLAELNKKRRRLERIESLMETTIDETYAALSVQLDKYEVIDITKEEHYFVYKMPYRTELASYDLREARSLIKYCKENFYNGTLNVSEVVLPENIEDGTFRKTYGAFKLRHSQIDDKRVDENVHIRPAGTYVTVATRCSGELIPEVYRSLLIYAEDSGYRPCGCAYEEDQLSYMAEHDRSNYLVRCYIQVEKAENT